MSDKHDFSSDDKPTWEVHTDKSGKDHVNIYDGSPSGDHSSIHINFDSNTGTGSIVDTSSGSKETTDISCFLTTACMRHMMNNFDDNCEELTILRKFRDNYVAKDDIKHYYEIAPQIVAEIDKREDNNEVFLNIYNEVVSKCVQAIKNGEYDSAYDRYRNCVVELEEKYVRPKLEHDFVKVLKLVNE